MRRLRQRLSRLRRRMLFEDLLVTEGCVGGAYGFPQTEDPVWLLGVKYCPLRQRQALEDDFRSRIWMTYRRGFPSIGAPDGPTSDRGWGCMLRCGQMVLAEALIRATAGRNWRWTPNERSDAYLRTVAQFADVEQAPFSIHQIALTGERTAHKPIGTWFGPNTVGQALRHVAAARAARVTDRTWPVPVLHVAMDSCVVKSDVRAVCGDWHQPLVLLVPLRLGLTELNPVYASGVKACFTIPHCVGIIAVSVGRKCTESEREADQTYHCAQPCFMRISSLDPSLAVAFYCGSEQQFESLCEHIQRILIDTEKYPLFELRDSQLDWQSAAVDFLGAAAAPWDAEPAGDDSRAADDDSDSEDDFVVL
ncbi:Cysteine protease ATG4B [Amphibalanus amphitrite]|uniref:Cysteine protease n=1 Tax=Amphibalanus amphitrite TaxID=1232801 RepID=A0A6A4WXW4_AMPAM|nr:Cysteine protease ATG4B [Amphibalanus amphitrite]